MPVLGRLQIPSPILGQVLIGCKSWEESSCSTVFTSSGTPASLSPESRWAAIDSLVSMATRGWPVSSAALEILYSLPFPSCLVCD